MNSSAEIDPERPRTLATEQAILNLLHASNAAPGHPVDIYAAQRAIERRGMDRHLFSAAMVQLLSRGVISLMGNAFFLTNAGYEVVKRGAYAGEPNSGG